VSSHPGEPEVQRVSGETEQQRVNRELIELLNELRVALPGVQVLFAFLLVVPFSNGFSKVTTVERAVYFGSFLCAAATSALLIAPSAYHRLHFRSPPQDKERMLFTANRLAITGTMFLVLAIGGVVFFITDFLYHEPWGGLLAALAAGTFGWFWYGLPLTRLAAIRTRTGLKRLGPGGEHPG
jgi:hypothetical protein